MKILKIGVFLLPTFLLLGIISACQQKQPPVDDKLKDVQVGPPLQHVQNVSIGRDSIPKTGLPQKSGMVNITILEGNQRFQGELSRAVGRIEAKENTLLFVPTNGKPLDIRLDLPEGLALANIAPSEVILGLRDLSNLDGADQFLSIETKERLLLGNIWRVQSDPNSIEFGKGFKIIQETLGEGGKQKKGYTEVKCFLSGPNGRSELVLGRVTDIPSGNATYSCLLEISSYHKPDDPGEDGREGYILKSSVILKSVK